MMFAVTTLLMLLTVSNLDDKAVRSSFVFASGAAQLLYYIGLFGASDYQITDYRRVFGFRVYGRLKLYSSVAMVAVCPLLLPWTGSTAEAAVVGLLTLYYMVCSVGELYQNVFFQNRRLDLYGKALFYRSLLATLAFIVTMALTRQLVLSLVACLVGTVLGVWWWAFRPARRDFLTHEPGTGDDAPPDDRSDAQVRRLARQCLPLFLIAFVSYAIQVLPRFVIPLVMDDKDAVGVFGLLTQPAFVIILVNQFIFRPVLDRYNHLITSGDAPAFWRLKRQHLAAIVALTAALMVFVYFLGVPIMHIAAGDDDLHPYRAEMTLLVAYGGALVMCGLNYWMTTLLRKQKEALYVHLAVAGLSLVVTPLAVHYAGLMGASLSLVGILLVLQTALAVLVRRTLDHGPFRSPSHADR